jgi:hypothetical protein
LDSKNTRLDFEQASKLLTSAANQALGSPKVLKVNIITAVTI